MISWPLDPSVSFFLTRLDGGIGGFLRYQTWEQTDRFEMFKIVSQKYLDTAG